MTSVLDASALLAHLLDEPGADLVEDALAEGAVVSTVNLAEVLAKLSDVRADLAELFLRLAGDLGSDTSPRMLPTLSADERLLPDSVTVEPFSLADAMICAALRPATKGQGLSLGDRACLALGRRLGAPVITADRRWSELRAPVASEIVVIR